MEISGVFKLRKANLIELLVGEICSKEFLRSRLTCLTDEELALFMVAVNSTRIRENRGHTPDEIEWMHRNKKSQEARPTRSVKAPVNVLAGNFAYDGEMANKKVYLKDLCPCGSGKKYKKCCGRK